MTTLRIDMGHESRQSLIALVGNFPQPYPKLILKTYAGLVTRYYDRSFRHWRLHGPRRFQTTRDSLKTGHDSPSKVVVPIRVLQVLRKRAPDDGIMIK